MAVYLVTWDLNKEKPSYAQARVRFIGAVEQFENIKDPSLDSVRFIATSKTAQQISQQLRECQDSNDTLVVARLPKGEYYGWLATGVWAWIDARA